MNLLCMCLLTMVRQDRFQAELLLRQAGSSWGAGVVEADHLKAGTPAVSEYR